MNEYSWGSYRTAYAKGAAFVAGRLLRASGLAERLAEHTSFDGFVAVLRELNGFFAAVLIGEESAFISADHVRGFPLFYAVQGKYAFVSDDANWVRGQLGLDEVDDLSVTEFLLTRSVSGSDTLFQSIKQVQAGEAVALTLTSEGVRVEANRFYEFSYGRFDRKSLEESTAEFREALNSAFQRLIGYAAGKTIVVPLGGGLDSRLIMLMLNRAGYGKVISFTYGRPGNREARMSRRVASELGFPWIFIPYTNRTWRDWYMSKEWDAYSQFANGLSTTPHLQDWPAVWELRRQGLIPDDSVFAPGHTKLGLSPSAVDRTLPTEWLKVVTGISEDELVTEICARFCTLQDWSRRKDTIQPKLCMKIKNVLRPPATMTQEKAIEYFDRWWWESSEAKFIINSVRVYDFWKYTWWLPLWDLQFVRFCCASQFDLRFGKRFERSYVRRVESEVTGKPAVPDTSQQYFGPVLVRILNKLRLRRTVRRIRARFEYGRHHYAWYGLIPEDVYKRAFRGQENINTYLAIQTIRSVLPDYVIPKGLDLLADKTRR